MKSTMDESWIIVVLAMVCCTAAQMVEHPDTSGSDFIFAIPSDYVYKRTASQRVFLSSQAGRTVKATIVTSGSNFRHVVDIPSDHEVVVELPKSLASRGSGLKQNAVGIEADGDISAHVQMTAGVNSGAYTPLPTKGLGREYIIGIYEPLTPRYRAGFTVTATRKGALLHILFSRTIAYGQALYGPDRVFQFRLEPFESFQVMVDQDLTGTRIVSDQPVAVVAGSECSRVPRGIKYCDYLVEQMPPLHSLGKQFVVAPFKDRISSYVLRIIAPFNGTSITFASPGMSSRPIHLNENQFHEVNYNQHAELQFQTSKPVLVLQFMKGFQSGDFVGDPSMVVIPPVEQFLVGRLTIASMDNDHVSIIVTNTNTTLTGLMMNGEGITRSPHDWSVIVDDVVGILHGTLASGSHVISHTDPNARFMVFGYGTEYLSGRAFPVAYNLKRLYIPSKVPLLLPPTGYDVQCLNTSMMVTLDTSVFLIKEEGDVTLNDQTCRHVLVHEGAVQLKTDFASCGTEVQENATSVTFSNTMWFAESVVTPVSPSRELTFRCTIAQQAGGISALESGSSLNPDRSVLSDDVLGDLSVSLVQYMDDTFGQGATGNASRSTGGSDPWADFMAGSQGQNVFAVNVTSSVDTSVFVDTCWTSPGPDPEEPQNGTELIRDGCEIDDTIRIGASVDDPTFRPIAVDSFSPIGEYHEVFMHCRVQVCRGVEASTDHCWQECRPRARRSARGMRGSGTTYTLTAGPISTR